jgi:PilZ domain
MQQRRGSQRIPLELPVEIWWKNRTGGTRQASGKVGNISGNGLFIEISARPRLETPVRFKVLLPQEVTQVPLELLCSGRVVRWNQRGQVQGLGAIIDDYELHPAPRSGPATLTPEGN